MAGRLDVALIIFVVAIACQVRIQQSSFVSCSSGRLRLRSSAGESGRVTYPRHPGELAYTSAGCHPNTIQTNRPSDAILTLTCAYA